MLYDNNSTENINPLKADLLMPSLKNRWHMFSPLVSLMSVKSFRMWRSSWSIIRNWCIKVNDAQHNSLCQHSRVHNYSTNWHLNQFGTYHTIWYVSNPSAASVYIRLLPIMPMSIRTVLADEISFGFGWCQRAVALLEWHPSLLYAVMDSDVTWNCLSWNSNLHKQTKYAALDPGVPVCLAAGKTLPQQFLFVCPHAYSSFLSLFHLYCFLSTDP